MSKLSAYTEATSGAAADFLYVVQGGVTKKLAIGNIAEAGTWPTAPIIRCYSTPGGPHSYSTQFGYYARVGKIVWITCKVTTTSLGAAGTGALCLGNLPFAMDAEIDQACAGVAISGCNMTVTAGHQVVGFVQPSLSLITLGEITAGVFAYLSGAAWPADGSIGLSAVYLTV